MANEVGELMKARREIKVLKDSLEVVSDVYKRLEEEIKRLNIEKKLLIDASHNTNKGLREENELLRFMIANGFGWDDMKGGNIGDVS